MASRCLCCSLHTSSSSCDSDAIFSLLFSPSSSSCFSFCHPSLFLCDPLCSSASQFAVVMCPPSLCLSSAVLLPSPIIYCFTPRSCSQSLFSLLLSFAVCPSILLPIILYFKVVFFLVSCPSPVFSITLSFLLSFPCPSGLLPIINFYFLSLSLCLHLVTLLLLSLSPTFLSPSLPRSLSFYSLCRRWNLGSCKCFLFSWCSYHHIPWAVCFLMAADVIHTSSLLQLLRLTCCLGIPSFFLH